MNQLTMALAQNLIALTRVFDDVEIEGIGPVAGEYVLLGIIILVLVILILVRNLFIVPQATVYVIERLGTYRKTWQTGLHMKAPFIERVATKVSLKEKVADFDPQAVITKDNVTMQIDTVVFYQITDPVLYTYGIEQPIPALENLSATTLRNIIGDLELDETLTSRDVINTRMRVILDEATDPWGIKVNRVELKNILPPTEVQMAMEKQVKAEREKRESILRAQGEKESLILVAEGRRQEMILAADANRERQIREAEGQAEAIRKVAQARAEALRYIKEVNADDSVIALRSLEALERVGDGRSTKIIIPSEIQNLAGLVTSIRELAVGHDLDDSAPATADDPTYGSGTGMDSQPRAPYEPYTPSDMDGGRDDRSGEDPSRGRTRL